MTNITIDRKFLEEVVELFDSAITARHPHEILRDIRAALVAPATAPAWHDAQQAEIESLRWTVKDALESLDNGMTADCRATLSAATKETP